ncbi:hypothetical protein MACJ_001659 [Theileria orientalis]|uniref:SfiI-subtelomeric related protein family member n=1 Tax=Theileria orientalis TaxID=68886 RepID=A0A976QSQ3_THEOR|nr:hypothetical protein MACJ_001659 [Theileria orientalis]
MFITKYLLLFFLIYGKNIVESSVTSSSDDGNFVSGADTKTVGSDRGLAAGDDAKGDSLATPELKLFKTDADGNQVEMKTNDFSQNNYSGYLIYEFKPRVECTLVKFGEAEVWKKGVDSVEEPISVSYNSDEHKVVLFDDKKSVFYKKNNSGNWVHHLTIQRNEPALTDTSGSGEGKGNTVELGSLYPESYGSTVDVTPKLVPAEEASKDKVASDGTTVELGSLYPDAGGSTVEVKAKSAAPASEDTRLTSGEPAEGDGSSTPLTTPAGYDASESSSSDPDFKLFGPDPKNPNAIVEFDSNKYDKKNPNEIRIDYYLKSDVKCTLIIFDGEEFWRHGEFNCQDHPTTFSYRNNEIIVIHLGDGFVRYDKDKHGIWNVIYTSNLKTSGEQVSDPSSEEVQSRIVLSGGSTHTGSVESGDGSQATPPTSGDDGSTVNPGQGATVIPPADTANKTSFELDIKKDAGTDEFDYKKDNKIATFTAKGDHAFSVVKQDKNEIWRTDKETEYATEVVLNGKGQKEKIVTIYLTNNTTKSYKKDGQNKPWNEYTGELPSADSAKSEVLGFELDIKSDDIKSDDYHFDVEKSYGRDLYIITFKAVVECSSVKVDDKEVWKHDASNSDDVNPRTVTFCKDKNRVRIHFGDHTIVYKKVNDKWIDTADLKATSTNSTSGQASTPSSGGTEKTSGGSGDGSQGTTQPEAGANQNPEETSQ